MKNSPPRGVDYGSLVEVKTLDERTTKFRVTTINSDGLGGASGFYRYADMSSLKVDDSQYKKDRQNNALSYILGVLGIAALIFVVASSDSVTVCSPAPCHQP